MSLLFSGLGDALPSALCGVSSVSLTETNTKFHFITIKKKTEPTYYGNFLLKVKCFVSVGFIDLIFWRRTDTDCLENLVAHFFWVKMATEAFCVLSAIKTTWIRNCYFYMINCSSVTMLPRSHQFSVFELYVLMLLHLQSKYHHIVFWKIITILWIITVKWVGVVFTSQSKNFLLNKTQFSLSILHLCLRIKTAPLICQPGVLFVLDSGRLMRKFTF